MRLARLVFFGLMGCGGGEATVHEVPPAPTCPAGYSWNGAACTAVVVDTSCPGGTQFVAGRGCVAIVVQAPEQRPHGPTVARTVWVERMIERLPPALCTPTSFFRNCFTGVGEAECVSISRRLTDSCLRDARLPPQFDEGIGEREGTKIGTCVGLAFDADMRARSRAIDSAECRDVNRWK